MLEHGGKFKPVKVSVEVNPAYLFLWRDQEHRYKVLKGGGGSGKSHSIGQYLLSQFLSIQGCNILITRKVAATIRGSVFALMKQLITAYRCEHLLNVNNNEYIIKHRLNGNMIFFKGLDDPEKVKSITADNGNIEKAWLEEASEMDKVDLLQLDTRLRGDSGIMKEIILSFNPISEEHWLKETFFDRKSDSVFCHNSTYKDNLFLDEEYKKTLEGFQSIDPYYYSVYCLGEWGAVGMNDTVIPYKLVYEARYRTEVDDVGVLCIGVDCARYGDDETVAYIKRGGKVYERVGAFKQDGNQNADMILSLMARHRKGSEKVHIKVDVGGLGASTVDSLKVRCPRHMNVDIIEINYGGRAREEDRYANVVTEMYYNFAALLPQLQLLKADVDVVPELTKRKYMVDFKTGLLKLEPKDDFKKRIKKSPDNADALVTAFYQPKEVSAWYKNL